MSGADFWATSVVRFGCLNTSAALTGSMMGRPPAARLANDSMIASAVAFTSSERPVTEAVTPAMWPPLPSRNWASRAGRATLWTSGLRDFLIALASSVGPHVPSDHPNRIQLRTVAALIGHCSLPATIVTSLAIAVAFARAELAASVEMTGGMDAIDRGTVTSAGAAGSRRAATSAAAVEAWPTTRPWTDSVLVKPFGDTAAVASTAARSNLPASDETTRTTAAGSSVADGEMSAPRVAVRTSSI